MTNNVFALYPDFPPEDVTAARIVLSGLGYRSDMTREELFKMIDGLSPEDISAVQLALRISADDEQKRATALKNEGARRGT